ncbi:MAG TPA: CoA transferase [Acidimicrobiales bacterium]|nr:CoA transferase [Acidimicrobiales bacterium]
MTRPLEGLTLLDLTDCIAGAYCTKLLVDGGARAVVVEPPGGARLRRWWASGQGDEPPGTGALFEWLRASTESVTADLETAEGRDLVLTLAGEADVVIESLAPGRIEALGLGLDRLADRRPSTVLVSISDFGRGVAVPDVTPTELTLQARSGSVGGRGQPERFPLAAGGRLGEWSTGIYAAVGALVGWRQAKQRGVGEHVDLSRLESMAITLVGYATLMRNIAGANVRPYRRSVELPSVERAADGWVGLCTVTNVQWQAFATMIGQHDKAEGDWAMLAYRLAHRAEAEAMIEAYTKEHSVAELLEEAADFRIPAAPVVEGSKIASIEPFASLGTYVRSPSGRFLAPRPPYRFSRCELRPPGDCPSPGEHTERARRMEPARPAPAPAPRPVGRPFEGLRMIDFSAFWAGPYATALVAALGADVIKVESIARPDPMRFNVATTNHPLWYEHSALFGSANANKRGITLALDTEEGRELALRLVAGADLVFENFTPRVMERFGLAYDDLVKVRPDLVMLRMPAFGAEGPWRDRGGFAQTMEQITGMAWITGYPGGPPLIPRGACDPIAGMHAVVALLMALEHRDRTGEGQLVEVAMVETAANVAAEIVIEWSAYGRELTRDGNHGPDGSPQGVYRCTGDDEWVALSVADDGQWPGLVAALGSPAWAAAPDLAAEAGRRRRATEVDGHLSAWAAPRDAAEAASHLLAHGVPAARVLPADRQDEVAELTARGFYFPVEHPVVGRHDLPGWPLHFSALTEGWCDRPAPLLGQHNEEVLGGELGLSTKELLALEEKGVIGRRLAGA